MGEPISLETVTDDDTTDDDAPPAGDDDETEHEHEQAEQTPAEDAPDTEAAATTPEEWERRFTVAERRFKTYRAVVEKEWAEDAVHLVPFNLDPGAPPGYIDTRNAGHVEDETRSAALAFLGMHAEAEMRADPYSVPCSTCEGWGQVRTGSLVPNMETRGCLDCETRGYIPTGQPANRPAVLDVPPSEPVNGHTVPAAVGPESPEINALRMQGYTIIPPMVTAS